MFEEVEEIVEGGRENYWTVPVEDVKDGAGESKVRGLNNLSCPKLEDRVDGKDYME